ncbi:MAG: 2-hydroxyacid dehydrogenase [Sphingomonadaceae bacterium]|jgi:glyoxylate reductase
MTVPDRPARPKVIVTRELTDGVMARMEELFETRLNREDRALTRAELEAAVADADVLVPTITDRIDADLIAKAGPRLKLIANFGVGVDHIDLHAARERRILVTNTPGVLTEDTADMTMALILSVPRRLGEGEKLIRAGAWDGWKPSGMLGHRVNGKTLGIIGMGRIGRAVARRAQGFGIRTIYHNRHRLPEGVEAELGARFVDLDSLFTQSDIISINCPHTPETHHLVNAERLAQMRPDAYLVNTSRGEVLEEDALIKALQSGQIAGAGLDVYVNEPHVDPRLLDLPNTVLLPHMGSATYEGRAAMGEKVIANIRAWVDGHRPPDQVLEGWD